MIPSPGRQLKRKTVGQGPERCCESNLFLSTTDNATFFSCFGQLQQFKRNGTFTDMTFIVDGKSLKAHKLVLSIHSEVFEAMFTNEMLEARKGEVVINDIKSKIFSLFLDYLYTGCIPHDIGVGDAVDLFMCSDKYQVESLMYALEKLLVKRLSHNNVIDMLMLADSFDRGILEKATISYVWLCLKDVMKTEGWSSISENTQMLRKLAIKFHTRVRRSLERTYPLRTLECARKPLGSLEQFMDVWEIDKDLRPKEFKLKSRRREDSCYSVVFDINGKSGVPHFLELAVHLHLNSRIPPGSIVPIYFKIYLNVGKVQRGLILRDIEGLLVWGHKQAHQTLGNMRVEIFRSPLPPEANLLVLEAEVVDWQCAVHGERPECNPLNCSDCIFDYRHCFEDHKTVVGWQLEHPSQATMDIDDTSVDGVSLIFGEKSFSVDRTLLFKRLNPPDDSSWPHGREFLVPSASESTGGTVFRYLTTGLFPSRDNVDIPLLEAAWHLGLADLVIYLEHALVWDLDPSNAVKNLNFGDALGLGFLKWGSLQYMKLHLDRVVGWDEQWKTLSAPLLNELLLEMNQTLSPCLLPSFLVPRGQI